MTATEYVILVDENDREIGLAEKLEAHQQCLLHRAFSVFIWRQAAEVEILLQQRALDKYHSPGLWTNTCCSHPRKGESIIAAGQRRLREEMGIMAALEDIGSFHYTAHFDNGLSENELDHVLIGSVPMDTAFTVNPQEAHAFKWCTLNEIAAMLTANPNQFTPWFKQALGIAKQRI